MAGITHSLCGYATAVPVLENGDDCNRPSPQRACIPVGETNRKQADASIKLGNNRVRRENPGVVSDVVRERRYVDTRCRACSL